MKLSATPTTVLAVLGTEATLAAPVDASLLLSLMYAPANIVLLVQTDGITNAPTATVVARQVAVSTSQITNTPLSELDLLNSMIASEISSGMEVIRSLV